MNATGHSPQAGWTGGSADSSAAVAHGGHVYLKRFDRRRCAGGAERVLAVKRPGGQALAWELELHRAAVERPRADGDRALPDVLHVQRDGLPARPGVDAVDLARDGPRAALVEA